MKTRPRAGSRGVAAAVALALVSSLASCDNPPTPSDGSAPTDRSPAPQCTSDPAADILFVVDNSNGSYSGQAGLTYEFGVFLDALTGGDPVTAIRDLRIGVVSTDLGTPGSVVPSCANSDKGDDGLLNPIRNGLAVRTHQPWMTASPGRRPMRCTMDRNQYPNFLTFDAARVDPNDPMQTHQQSFREDFACNAYLSGGGCGLEQQLESAYRALVIHDARGVQRDAATVSPNAGFVRDEAVLGVFVVSDEEDGSTRDCRYAEPGVPCQDAISVFDNTSPDWSSNDLNLRFYMYTPGSTQDPTWPLDRYIDLTRPDRGFTSLKPGRPGLVVFGAVAGVPINPPRRANGGVDWDTLLGRNPDGSDGYTGMSPEGPISMRQRYMDPMCSTRVTPACRREGSAYNPMACDANTQFFAWPARRIAQVVRRFDERYGNGAIGSNCSVNFTGTFREFAAKVRARVCR